MLYLFDDLIISILLSVSLLIPMSINCSLLSVRVWLSMGMVIIQPYVLVSKLKKTKTKFLRCTGYLNSNKTPIKQDLLLLLFLVRLQNFLNC